jgi:hypothetical protein
MKDKMIRIGVFYDGNYFLHISNYYNYEHERGRRLSISGLHNFARLSTVIISARASTHRRPANAVTPYTGTAFSTIS